MAKENGTRVHPIRKRIEDAETESLGFTLAPGKNAFRLDDLTLLDSPQVSRGWHSLTVMGLNLSSDKSFAYRHQVSCFYLDW